MNEEDSSIKIVKIGKVLTPSLKDFISKVRKIIVNNGHKLHKKRNLVPM